MRSRTKYPLLYPLGFFGLLAPKALNIMPATLSEALGADHAFLDRLYEKIRAAPDLQSKLEWRNQFTWALARHAISEELTWYPAMEKHMGQEGIDMINHDREQHQAVRYDPRCYRSKPKVLLGERRPLQATKYVTG